MRGLPVAAAIGAVAVMGSSASALASQAHALQASQGTPRTFRMDPQLDDRLNRLSVGGSQLGVTLRDLDAAAAKEKKLASTQGVLVESVEPGGPADKGGIRTGDLISDYDGEHVRSVRQLRRLLGETPDGLPVRVGVIRDGRRLELSVTPGPTGPSLDDSFAELLRQGLDGNLRGLPQVPFDPLDPRKLRPSDEWSSGAGRLGIVTQEMTPQLGDYFGASDGVLVTSVTENSPAARAGLKAGDVVTAIGGAAVKTAADLARAIRAVPDVREVAIALVRNRQALTVTVKLDAARPRGRA